MQLLSVWLHQGSKMRIWFEDAAANENVYDDMYVDADASLC
jgi:hypothetical protein